MSTHTEDFPAPSARHPKEAGAKALATYYISPSGNDGNSGLSPGAAWKSLDFVNSQVFGPGIEILLEGGQTHEGGLVFDSESGGNAEQPITIGSYGGGRAEIRVSTGAAITLRNTAGFFIRDLRITGPGSSENSATDGVLLYADDSNGATFAHVVLQDLEISGFFRTGIAIESMHESDPGFSQVQILQCDVHDNGLNGVTSSGIFRVGEAAHLPHKNFTVRDCRFYNNTGQPGWPTHSGSGLLLAFLDGALIEYCEAFNNGGFNDACGGPVGIWVWEANNITIQHCESHHNLSRSKCDGGGFDFDGGVTNSVMQYNYSHENVGAGFGLFQFDYAHPYKNNVVRYNITQNEGMGGIHLWATDYNGGMQDTLIHNNTIFVGPDQPGGIVETDIGTSFIHRTRVYNNLIVVSPGRPVLAIPHPSTTWDVRGNAYFDPSGAAKFAWNGTVSGGLAAWRAVSGQEASAGIEIEPQLIDAGNGGTIGDPHRLNLLDAYRLQSTSPLLEAGLNLATLLGIEMGGRDFFGGPVPSGSAPDIGAHEFTQSGEGETCASETHTADTDRDGVIGLSELLRVIQLYALGHFGCAAGTEDGYAPLSNLRDCCAHDADYNTRDWRIDLGELLRVVQFYNSLGYHVCPELGTEDGFCPGLA